MNKICFIAQFPPPIHGLSKAVQTLYDSKLDSSIVFEKIDIKNNKKFLVSMIKILKSKADLFYFTISQTPGGNIRDLIILKLISMKKKNYIIHLHGGNYFRKMIDNEIPVWQKKMNYNLIAKAKRVIVLSESLISTFKGIVDNSKISVIPNCVDNKFLLSQEDFKIKNYNIDKKKIKNVLYLSNFIKEKGYQYVLQLAKLEKEEFEKTGIRKFSFDFAGKFFSEKEKNGFFKYIDENDLNNFIIYHGIVDGNEKSNLLKQADVMILLTTYFREGQPISIIEGMGNGLAIVATNHTAIPDMIHNNVNGIIVDKNNIDVNDIYKKMTNIEYKTISLNNYNECKKYSEKEYLNNCLSCFKECL